MKRILLLSLPILFALTTLAQLPVATSHPRILLDSMTKARLLTKKALNDPDWVALQAEADDYATRDVLPWTPNHVGIWNNDYLFYNYCGSSWEDAAMSLGMAHQLTKGTATSSFPTAYSTKLLELVDSILAGYYAYPPCSGCPNLFLWNSSYATRHVGNVLGVAYDWCYDELGPTRKAAMIAMFNDWFTYMRVPYNVYQNTVYPTGNYYFGHVLCAAYLGYATAHDNPTAVEMIDFARQRVLGTQSGSLSVDDLTDNWVAQTYGGGIPTGASNSYLGPVNYTAAPQKDGIPVQGWGYGGGNIKRLIDYCFMVRSATSEQIADSIRTYLDRTTEAFVHALTPNRFQIDNSNDWGSHIGNFLGYDLRLSAVAEGSPVGPMAEYIHSHWVQPVSIAATWNAGYPTLNWENLLYRDASRPSSPFTLSPFYPAVTQHTPPTVLIDEGLAKYYLREDWSDTATWCTLNMSNAVYDDHDHNNAGHFQILRGDSHDGDDLLLVGANEIGNLGFSTNGIEGGTCYHMSSSLSNTLFFDDYNDYSEVNTNGYLVGGQSFYGTDEPTHQEQNMDFTYVRADLTSAYYRRGELADTVNRTLLYFYRHFLYLREANVFVVYDQMNARNSTNGQGQYQKHLRWHFLESPMVSGSNITAIMDHSKLHIHTVIPDTVNIVAVDESNNPDNTFGPWLDYAFNTYTWRAEVSVPGNPLKQELLTVLQPSNLAGSEMATSAIATQQHQMEGSLISLNGRQELVLLNRQAMNRPAPIITATYAFTWHPATQHTLAGMVPNGSYQVDYNGSVVTVTQSASGNVTASPSGVLRFAVNLPNSMDAAILPLPDLHITPNPGSGQFTCHWTQGSYEWVEVSNALGQVIARHPVSQGMREVQLEVTEAGTYWMTLRHSQRPSITRRIVVTR